jgi:signal transduction histidine kinase
LQSVAWGWGVAAMLSTLLAAFAGVWVSRRFSAPLESLAVTTSQMAAGDLSARVELDRKDEFGLLGESFNKMAESVEMKVGTLQRFVADAAHQLGTPLTALRTNLELGEEDSVSIALDQVQQMDDLTKDLLTLSQLEAIESHAKFEEIDLVELVESLSEVYASRAEQVDLGFTVEIIGEGDMVKGDRKQIRILIENLLDNAIKFTPPGGEVCIKLKSDENVFLLMVVDTGIGIPEEDFQGLFSRFHRGRNAATYPGSGLGLAIVKAIVDQHGAGIDIQRNAKGTTVIVRFQ